jgi:exodeoxyribonuclease V gamma subunit
VYDGRLVYVSFSKNDSKYQLEAYIQYLAGRAMGNIEELSFISSKKGEAFTAMRLTQEEAMSRLEAMIQLYLKGHSSIVAFYPDLEEPGKTAELDLEKFRDKIEAKVNNYSYSFSDQYVLNEYNNGFFESEKVLDEFKKNCALLLTPLMQLFPSYY